MERGFGLMGKIQPCKGNNCKFSWLTNFAGVVFHAQLPRLIISGFVEIPAEDREASRLWKESSLLWNCKHGPVAGGVVLQVCEREIPVKLKIFCFEIVVWIENVNSWDWEREGKDTQIWCSACFKWLQNINHSIYLLHLVKHCCLFNVGEISPFDVDRGILALDKLQTQTQHAIKWDMCEKSDWSNGHQN